MANTRFLVTNLAGSGTLKNGSGGGAPGLDEVTGYPMTNALQWDRYTLWKQSSGADMNLDIDLGSASTVQAFGIFGQRGVSSTTALTGVEVFTQTGSYTPGGTWTSQGTITVGAKRDAGMILANSVASVRSVRFAFDVASAFTLGRVWAGALDYDMGGIYSPGARRTFVKPRIRNVALGMVTVATVVGDDRYLFDLPYESIDSTMQGKLLAVAQAARSIIYVDHDSNFYECLLAGDQFSQEHVWNSSAVYNASLGLEQLA
jgi:hypothetical protein